MGLQTSAIDVSTQQGRQLMAGVEAGDPIALQRLFNRYWGRIYTYLYGTIGNREDAMDVTQEVLIRVYEKAHLYDGSYPLTPWIYRVAGNLCTDHFRKKNFRLHANSVEFDDSYESSRRTLTTPEDETIHRETLARVKQVLDTLPRRQRRVLEMRLLKELRLREIAEAEGISVGTVKSTLHTALNRLRDSLAH